MMPEYRGVNLKDVEVEDNLFGDFKFGEWRKDEPLTLLIVFCSCIF